MRLAIAVPMKPLALAKARLRPGLGDAARQKLAADMLRHVLAAVAASRVAEARGVISADPAALALATEHGFEAISEPEPQGYNVAAARARAWAQARRCDALLILPSDLPFLTAADVQLMAFVARTETSIVVISPDARAEGTNALLLRPPEAIPFHFGPDSFRQHLHLAQLASIPAVIYHSPGLARDIDHPHDLGILDRKYPLNKEEKMFALFPLSGQN